MEKIIKVYTKIYKSIKITEVCDVCTRILLPA